MCVQPQEGVEVSSRPWPPCRVRPRMRTPPRSPEPSAIWVPSTGRPAGRLGVRMHARWCDQHRDSPGDVFGTTQYILRTGGPLGLSNGMYEVRRTGLVAHLPRRKYEQPGPIRFGFIKRVGKSPRPRVCDPQPRSSDQRFGPAIQSCKTRGDGRAFSTCWECPSRLSPDPRTGTSYEDMYEYGVLRLGI